METERISLPVLVWNDLFAIRLDVWVGRARADVEDDAMGVEVVRKAAVEILVDGRATSSEKVCSSLDDLCILFEPYPGQVM